MTLWYSPSVGERVTLHQVPEVVEVVLELALGGGGEERPEDLRLRRNPPWPGVLRGAMGSLVPTGPFFVSAVSGLSVGSKN